jgi:redox-sensing transcriptional repressor
MQQTISKKAIVRLSIYRRYLRSLIRQGESHVYSHELAARTGYTSSQVRRDLMGANAEGSASKGYKIKDLIHKLDEFLDGDEPAKVVLFGAGKLGKAILQFFLNHQRSLQLVAAFDNDLEKTDRVICGVHCYHIDQAKEIIPNLEATLAIITAPDAAIPQLSSIISESGIRGVLNFAPAPMALDSRIDEQHIDITSELQALACLSRSR